MKQFITNRFVVLSEWISANLGHPSAFGIAAMAVTLWALTGPYFDYSDTCARPAERRPAALKMRKAPPAGGASFSRDARSGPASRKRVASRPTAPLLCQSSPGRHGPQHGGPLQCLLT